MCDKEKLPPIDFAQQYDFDHLRKSEGVGNFCTLF